MEKIEKLKKRQRNWGGVKIQRLKEITVHKCNNKRNQRNIILYLWQMHKEKNSYTDENIKKHRKKSKNFPTVSFFIIFIPDDMSILCFLIYILYTSNIKDHVLYAVV